MLLYLFIFFIICYMIHFSIPSTIIYNLIIFLTLNKVNIFM